jgi:hypothetical protein
MIVEPVNRWRPVTNEYQRELAPFAVMPSLRKRDVEKFTAARRQLGTEKAVPIGITCITWFYFLRGCAYFLFASTLLSQRDPSLAAWLVQRSRVIIPFPVSASSSVSVARLLAVVILAMAIISVAVGVMWLARYWRIRWITMFYAGASLARAALYFISDRAAGITTQLSPEQRQTLAVGLGLNLLIFCYLAFYPGVARAFEKPI